MLKRTPKAELKKTPTQQAAELASTTPSQRRKGARAVVINPPKFDYATVTIRGIAPLVLNAFSQKAKDAIIATQMEGSRSRKGKTREPKDFEAAYQGARHIAQGKNGGWDGLPASAIRNALISSCRLCGFAMTLAKLSLFVEADGFDQDGTPLVRIIKGEPVQHTMHARPESGGMDIRVRPMWREGWEAKLRLRWDADQFSASDMINLLMRVGLQVGIGEGRPDSKKSAGLGWGLFEVVQ